MSTTSGFVPFSGVLPTYNRVEALRDNLEHFLALEGLAELIVVNDASPDDTGAFLASVDDPRLLVLTNERNSGSPASRRRGIQAAKSEWVLMMDDDVLLPADYGQQLIAEGLALPADVIGAPWLNVAPGTTPEDAAAQGRASAIDRPDLRTHPSAFPRQPVYTPFMCALAMFRRSVLTEAAHDSAYGGNAWREETDLFLRLAQAGVPVALTPATYSFQVKQYGGGQRRNPLKYEAWIAYNNWKFLRRHAPWLRREGLIRSAPHEQLWLLRDRARPYARAVARRLR